MKVGPGCDHCYAEYLMDHRWHRVKWGAGQPRVRTSAANWQQPLRWQSWVGGLIIAAGVGLSVSGSGMKS